MTDRNPDEILTFTVGTVWREERVSCPHPDVLRAYVTASLEEGAMQFLKFHLEECECPYCNAALEDIRLSDEEAAKPQFVDMRDRLLRSTRAALKRASG